MQQLWRLLLGATKTLPDRQAGFATTKAEAAKCQKYHDLQSNYHFQPVSIETTGVYGKTTAPFLSSLTKKHVDMSGDPRGSTSGSTSACTWLCSERTLSAYWPLCKFDLILSVLFFVAFNGRKWLRNHLWI